MIILTPGNTDIWKTPLSVGALASFCAEILRTRPLAGCLAAVPDDPRARRTFFTFMHSLRRASGGRCAVTLSTPSVTRELLLECELAGTEQLVVLSSADSSGDAIEEVAQYCASRPKSNLAIHVWVHTERPGGAHRTLLAWMHRLGEQITVEISPIEYVSNASMGEAAPGRSAREKHDRLANSTDALSPVACEWLGSTVTVDPSGTLVPCPHHSPDATLSLQRNPAELRFAAASFPQSLRGHPVCGGCTRRMRFILPDWLRSGPPTEGPDTGTATGSRAECIDSVGQRLDDVDPAKRHEILSAFLERARSQDIQ